MRWDEPSSWALAVAVCVALAMWGKPAERRIIHYTFKPLALALIVGAALFFPTGLAPLPYKLFILGLIFGLAGDVLLMFEQRFFLLGLISFLVGHVCYIAAFSMGVEAGPLQWAFLLPPATMGAVLTHQLWPHLGSLRLPTLCYVIAIVVMAWRMLARFEAPEIAMVSVLWGAAGASLFVISDGLLAFRRLAHKAVLPYGIEFSAYFAAQWALFMASITI